MHTKMTLIDQSEYSTTFSTPVLEAITSKGGQKFWQGHVALNKTTNEWITYTTYCSTLSGKTLTSKVDNWEDLQSNVVSKITISAPTTIEGKNIGKSNETTPEEQAVFEINSTYKKQIDKGYYPMGESSSRDNMFVLPMLAYPFSDKSHKVTFPLTLQPKYDGCMHGDTLVITERGQTTIKRIVEEKLQVKVLSFNEDTQEFQFKSIVNWFNNGLAQSDDWLDIMPLNGGYIKCTKNHKIFTDSGWFRADELDPSKHRIYVKAKYKNQNEFEWTSFNVRPSSQHVHNNTKYDLEIEDNHNYIAGGILVHNCRALSDGTQMWSRKGKEFLPQIVEHILGKPSQKNQTTGQVSLNDLFSDISSNGGKLDTLGHIVDGELILPEGHALQDTVSAAKKFYPELSPKLLYRIYDIVDTDLCYTERYKIVQEIVRKSNHDQIIAAPVHIIHSEDEMHPIHEQYVSEGWEGTMIRLHGMGYNIGQRTHQLLKLKDFLEEEFLVIDIKEGSGKFSGAAIFVCQTKEGAIFDTVPIGTMEQRQYYFQNPDKIIGTYWTVRFQAWTKDKKPQFGRAINQRDSDIQG